MFDIFKKTEEDKRQEKTDKIERFFGINLAVKYESDEIRRFFSTRVSGMREEFVQEVKRHFAGYTGFNSIESFPGNIVSINELLHLYHSYTMNNIIW